MHLTHRNAFCIAGAMLGGLTTTAAAQSYPAKPIRFVAPSSAGSGVDIVCRLLAPKLSEALGQQVVVDNRAGVGGNLGAEIAARAAPDGYTLFMATPSQPISSSLHAKLNYDLLRDFVPISLLTTGHFMLVVHPSVPAKSVKELIALAQSRPGKLNYASAGIGNATHLAGELFNIMAKVKTVHIPYKGGGLARNDMLGGQVDFMFHNITAVLGDVQSGRLRGLAVTGPKRALAAPDLPTVAEAALPGYEITSWFGVMAPADTAQDVLARLHREFVRAVQLPDIKEKLANLGAEPVGGSPADFAAFVKTEIARWAAVIKSAGIPPQ